VVAARPLRKRSGDAVLLAQAFLKRFAAEQRVSLRFADDALGAIERHEWPGNVRQLLNVVKRAAIMCEGQRVGREDLGLTDDEAQAPSDDTLDLRVVRDAAERQAVVRALGRSNGNIAKAAELLGVSRPTLYDLMNRLSIKTER
jgi:two-component system NtrC family response regulator